MMRLTYTLLECFIDAFSIHTTRKNNNSVYCPFISIASLHSQCRITWVQSTDTVLSLLSQPIIKNLKMIRDKNKRRRFLFSRLFQVLSGKRQFNSKHESIQRCLSLWYIFMRHIGLQFVTNTTRT